MDLEDIICLILLVPFAAGLEIITLIGYWKIINEKDS